jgi:hypothetical protein
VATSYQGSFNGSGQVTFQSSSHPVYQVTVNGTTTANVTFSADLTTFTATETSSATAHFHVIQDSTGGFQDFDDNETDTRSLSGSVNSFIGLLISTSKATANFNGAFTPDHNQITGNATLTFSGFDGSVGLPITLDKKAQLLPVISFSSGTSSITEGGTANYTLTRSFVGIGDTGSDVDVQTQDGTAVAGINYTALSTHVHFGAGQTTAAVPIGVTTKDNNTIDTNPNFHVLLVNAVNATIGLSEADTTILDNDQPGPPYPTLPPGATVLPASFSGTFQVPDGNATVGSLSSQFVTIRAAFGNHSFYTGLHGNTTLVGGAGNDHFFAASGGNTYVGGTGSTMVDYSLASSGSTVNLANGTETGAFIGSDVLTNIHNVVGTNFSDTFIVSSSNDAINGGAGFDTAVFSGPRASYNVGLRADGAVIVSGPDGSDVFTNMEALRFSNVTIATPKFPHWIGSSDIGSHPAGYVPTSTGDFNHDGTNDILWYNSATLDADLWKLGNAKWAGSVDIGAHPAGYNLIGSGDFNHDGTPDVLWYNPASRDLDIWKISNSQWAGSVDVGLHPPGAQPLGGGDFNGDGTSDVLWYNASSNGAEIWMIQNGQWAASVDIGTHPAGWVPLASADIDHDGTMDLLWFNPTTNDVDIWKISNAHWAGSIDIGSHPAGYSPARVVDFNNDGSPDILWFNATTGDAELWLLQNGHWTASVDLGQHPTGWAPAGIGDFNHDGNADILWRDPATNHVEAWLLSNS